MATLVSHTHMQTRLASPSSVVKPTCHARRPSPGRWLAVPWATRSFFPKAMLVGLTSSSEIACRAIADASYSVTSPQLLG